MVGLNLRKCQHLHIHVLLSLTLLVEEASELLMILLFRVEHAPNMAHVVAVPSSKIAKVKATAIVEIVQLIVNGNLANGGLTERAL
jgi:hypothetical protein